MKCHYKICFYFLLIATSLFHSSCYETKTLLSNPNEALYRIKQPVYCGTFSSFVYYDKSNKVIFNDSLSHLSNVLYDSIIRHNFKRIPFVGKNFIKDTSEAVLLSLEFLNVVNQAEKNQSIKNYKVSDILSKLTASSTEDYFLFFVPTGYNRSWENIVKLKREQNYATNELQIASAIGSALASALTGGIFIFMFTPQGQAIHEQGANCHAILYKKSSNEITFYRRLYTNTSSNNHLNRKELKKQVQYSLKEYL